MKHEQHLTRLVPVSSYSGSWGCIAK
ncbi:unnamed protein product [Coffea canephora]|uniref:Uncharacterized protein n=1 Tax=Coffea canephora TaxID=49390 RepID=A0A068U5H8_COFCA|nr:unnamed protein product [Coffea canephora]